MPTLGASGASAAGVDAQRVLPLPPMIGASVERLRTQSAARVRASSRRSQAVRTKAAKLAAAPAATRRHRGGKLHKSNKSGIKSSSESDRTPNVLAKFGGSW